MSDTKIELEMPKSWDELQQLANDCQAHLDRNMLPTPQQLYAKGACDMFDKLFEATQNKKISVAKS